MCMNWNGFIIKWNEDDDSLEKKKKKKKKNRTNVQH